MSCYYDICRLLDYANTHKFDSKLCEFLILKDY